MIAVAPYPRGWKLDQTALSYFYYNMANNGPTVMTQKYKQALEHYNAIQQWCTENCQGPYDLAYSDILHDGIRVRLGSKEDLAFFQLKWLT
jgi:hypothetical protein